MVISNLECCCVLFLSDQVSTLLKKLFEGYSSKDPVEMFVKAAAEGNLKQLEDLCKVHNSIVSANCNYQ